MSPRTGRPKIQNPKCVEVKVRFDKKSNKNLLAYCERQGITRTQAIRQGVELLIKSEKEKQKTVVPTHHSKHNVHPTAPENIPDT